MEIISAESSDAKLQNGLCLEYSNSILLFYQYNIIQYLEVGTIFFTHKKSFYSGRNLSNMSKDYNIFLIQINVLFGIYSSKNLGKKCIMVSTNILSSTSTSKIRQHFTIRFHLLTLVNYMS